MRSVGAEATGEGGKSKCLHIYLNLFPFQLQALLLTIHIFLNDELNMTKTICMVIKHYHSS